MPAVRSVTRLQDQDDLAVGDRTFFDDFERANVAGSLGVASCGVAWDPITGAAFATAGISSGRFVSPDGTCYAPKAMSPAPARIGGRFSFNGSNHTFAVVHFGNPANILDKMLHTIFDRNSFTTTWWNGASQGNGMQSGPQNGAFATPLALDGTVYEFWVTVNGNAVHIEMPDGTVADLYDTNVPAVTGAGAIWELTGPGGRWESVETFQVADVGAKGVAIAFPRGINGTPIGTRNPSSASFKKLGINTLAPTADVHIVQAGVAQGLLVEATGNHPILRIRANSGGFSPQVIFDEGAANPPRIYSGGNAQSIVIATNGSDRWTWPFAGGVTITDNNHIALGTTNGTKIGTATSQKLGFFNKTPVIQPSGTPADATDLASAITLVNDLKTKLVSLGLVA